MTDAIYYHTCTCRRPDGSRYGLLPTRRPTEAQKLAACPKMLSNLRHGKFAVYINVPATATSSSERIRRGNFDKREDAEEWAIPDSNR